MIDFGIRPNRAEISTHKIQNHQIKDFVDGSSYSVNNFGIQWTKWRETQLDSKSGVSITRDRLNRMLASVPDQFWEKQKKNNVLEAGCGSGRFSELLAEFENMHLTCVDLSDAVLANAKNHANVDSKRMKFVKADITDLPYDDGSFDLVVCIGVIQHTPNSRDTFQELIRVLKPGGLVVWDHYEFGLRRYTKLPVLLLRPLIKRLPSKMQLRVCEALVEVFLPAHKFLATKSILFQKVFSRISPVSSYFHVYPELNDVQQYTWALLDTHDTLTAWYENWITKKEANQMVLEAGAITVSLQSGGNGIEAVSMKIDD